MRKSSTHCELDFALREGKTALGKQKMRKKQIRDAIKAAPFKPFAVRLADGSRYRVPSADHVSLSPVGRILVVHVKGVAKILDVALITEIEYSVTS